MNTRVLDNQQADGLRVAFETLGCRSNYADTIDLQADLVSLGAVPCSFDSEADVYLINTCTVTDGADKTAYRLIRRARSQAPKARIIVTGCLAEVSQDQIEELGIVDAVVGPGRRKKVLSAILGENIEQGPSLKSPFKEKRSRLPVHQSISLDASLSDSLVGPGEELGEVSQRARYHLRIQEGCENMCTFCIIPFSRGRLSSRNTEDLVEDFHRLAELGYREVVLTGTHIGAYGEDIDSNLFSLLKHLSKHSGPLRLRLSSIDPNDLSREIIDLLAENECFCEHLHICVQAFSDRVLKRMNRLYRSAYVLEQVSYIEAKMPGIALGADIIAGFPGETREEFDSAVKLCQELPFSYLHVFPYSERSGTAATRLDGSVAVSERKRRVSRWRALSEAKRREYYKSFIGRDLEFVLENSDDQHFFGTTREFISVKVPKSRAMKSGSLYQAVGKDFDLTDGRLLCA